MSRAARRAHAVVTKKTNNNTGSGDSTVEVLTRPVVTGPPPRLGPVIVWSGPVGPRQFTAALLDLASRGHLTLWFHHLDTGRPRRVEDVLFERVPDAPGALTDAEAELIERLFSHGDCIAVDTLRRLAGRWPARLARELSREVTVASEPIPSGRASRGKGAARVGVLAGLLAFAGLAALGAAWLLDRVREPALVGTGALAVLLLAVIADQASRPPRADAALDRRLALYRAELREIVDGRRVRYPADYERLLGAHHPWAVVLEAMPDWLGLPDPRPDGWPLPPSPKVPTVWVRRGQTIPVVRHRASVRVVHRIPSPRKPRD